jgi:hypothetical protein
MAAEAAPATPGSSPAVTPARAVCAPRDDKTVPAGAARVLRRYVDRAAEGHIAAAQRLAAPGSPAASDRGVGALAISGPRLVALDDHY